MDKFRRLALLCLIVTHLHGAQSFRFEGSAECDFARSSYLLMEKNLWDKYVDKVMPSLTRNERLHKIFNQHYMFIQQHMNEAYNESDFSVLSRFYEWNNLQPDVKSVHSLFKDNFVHRLEIDLESNDVDGFNERAGLDLAETVLTDPLWPVNATLEKIQNNIYSQGLYYKAKSVRDLCENFCNRNISRSRLVLSRAQLSDSFQEATVTLCTSQRSAQQVLYQLYNAITMTELKGYAMMQFSYMLLKTYGKGESKTKDINDRASATFVHLS
jgi:Domain of unknown function (DUF4803)